MNKQVIHNLNMRYITLFLRKFARFEDFSYLAKGYLKCGIWAQ